ncbi:MAG TPA: lipoprotein [Xanthobacteraceae bacterium]|nr:lipoprotein [Xanthobacteraceae bacterium]
MSRTPSPASSRWAVILLTAATLALAGCGRKGPLDLPPSAPAQPGVTEDAAPAEQGTLFNPSPEQNREPAAARGRKRSFVLDPLLD